MKTFVVVAYCEECLNQCFGRLFVQTQNQNFTNIVHKMFLNKTVFDLNFKNKQ